MNKAALSVRVFGIYLIVLGAWLLLAPNVLLRLFGMAATDEVWIRVVGMLVGFLGTYYVRAAAARFTPFFAWTIPVRTVGARLFRRVRAAGPRTAGASAVRPGGRGRSAVDLASAPALIQRCSAASTTATADMLMMRRTVDAGVRIWTGWAAPSSTAPIVMPPPAVTRSAL